MTRVKPRHRGRGIKQILRVKTFPGTSENSALKKGDKMITFTRDEVIKILRDLADSLYRRAHEAHEEGQAAEYTYAVKFRSEAEGVEKAIELFKNYSK